VAAGVRGTEWGRLPTQLVIYHKREDMQNPNELISKVAEAQDRLFFLAESLDVSRRVPDSDRLIMTKGASLVISDCKAVLEKVEKALTELQRWHD
jgi:hypothetical protein